MNAILGFTEIIKQFSLSKEKKYQYLDTIEKSGYELLKLINDIIEIAKIHTKQIKPSICKLSLNEKLRNLHTSFKAECHQKGIKFDLSLPLDDTMMLWSTDEEMISSCIQHLLNHALAYAHSGIITLGYTADSKDPNNSNPLVFYVKHQGNAVPDQIKQDIFNSFAHIDTPENPQSDGMGLGITIAKEYIHLLGGEIWLENKIDKEFTFFFTLPKSSDTTQ